MRNVLKFLTLAAALSFAPQSRGNGPVDTSAVAVPHPVLQLLQDSLGAPFVKSQEFDYYSAKPGFMVEAIFDGSGVFTKTLDKKDHIQELSFYSLSADSSKVYGAEIVRDGNNYRIFTGERKNVMGALFNDRTLVAVTRDPMEATRKGLMLYRAMQKK